MRKNKVPLIAGAGYLTLLAGFVIWAPFRTYKKSELNKIDYTLISEERKETKIQSERYEEAFNSLFGRNGLADVNLNGEIEWAEYIDALNKGGYLGDKFTRSPPLQCLYRAAFHFRTKDTDTKLLHLYGPLR